MFSGFRTSNRKRCSGSGASDARRVAAAHPPIWDGKAAERVAAVVPAGA
jgi:hypothetical protein